MAPHQPFTIRHLRSGHTPHELSCPPAPHLTPATTPTAPPRQPRLPRASARHIDAAARPATQGRQCNEPLHARRPTPNWPARHRRLDTRTHVTFFGPGFADPSTVQVRLAAPPSAARHRITASRRKRRSKEHRVTSGPRTNLKPDDYPQCASAPARSSNRDRPKPDPDTLDGRYLNTATKRVYRLLASVRITFHERPPGPPTTAAFQNRAITHATGCRLRISFHILHVWRPEVFSSATQLASSPTLSALPQGLIWDAKPTPLPHPTTPFITLGRAQTRSAPRTSPPFAGDALPFGKALNSAPPIPPRPPPTISSLFRPKHRPYPPRPHGDRLSQARAMSNATRVL